MWYQSVAVIWRKSYFSSLVYIVIKQQIPGRVARLQGCDSHADNASFRHMRQHRDSLITCRYLLLGSNFHLSTLKRVKVATPSMPINTFAEFIMFATQRHAVQVAFVTIFEPPTAFVLSCALSIIRIIVPVHRAKWGAVVPREWISWNTENVTRPTKSSTIKKK